MLPVLGCLLIGCVTSVLAQTDGGNRPTLLGGDRPTLVGGAIDSTSELITAGEEQKMCTQLAQDSVHLGGYMHAVAPYASIEPV